MPLTATEIKIELLRRGVSIQELARRWHVYADNISRVIHRRKGFSQQEIRKKLANFLGVPLSEVGREPVHSVPHKTKPKRRYKRIA